MATSNKTEDTDFYNPHDAVKRHPGVYLDDVERKHDEDRRAFAEDREPDYDDMPASTGTPLVTRGQLPRLADAVDIEPFTTLPVDTGGEGPTLEDAEKARVEAENKRDDDIEDARRDDEESKRPDTERTAPAKKATAKKATATKK